MNERKEPAGLSEEERFAQQAKELFDQSVQKIDGHTLSRLNRARQAALAEIEQRRRSGFRLTQWLPAAGVTAVAVFAIVLWTGEVPVDPVAPPTTVTDFELLLAEDSFEMLEDLEFYAWIDFDAHIEDSDDTDGNVG